MGTYDIIKTNCLKDKVLWEDTEFPAISSSVFYHQVPDFQFEWKRPRELYKDPKFILSGCDDYDVIKGSLGDRWLLSCFAVLYSYEDLFSRVVPHDQDFSTNYAGIFRFEIWWNGDWVEVLIDDRLPTVDGKLAFIHCPNTKQMWPALLEKALAKLHGSYEALKYGNKEYGFVNLTGGITDAIPTEQVNFLSLKKLLASHTIVTVQTDKHPTYMCPRYKNAIKQHLLYRVFKVKEIKTSEGVMRIVMLHHPTLTNSVWCIESQTWSLLPFQEKSRVFGQYAGLCMQHADFVRTFSRLEIVYLNTNTTKPYLDEQDWHTHTYNGRWIKGITAGGCENNTEFFHMNPQIQIESEKPDTLLVSLYQHNIVDPKVIGFTIFEIAEPLLETAPSSFLANSICIMRSRYENGRQINVRCSLRKGVYLIIPSTFESRVEANFTLRICTRIPVTMKVLDNIPKNSGSPIKKAPSIINENPFHQYEPQFLQLADEQKTINTFELHELLDMCLPNDYLKSAASIDTCRQVVLTMSHGSGRINLNDFKDLMFSLRHWQAVFQKFCTERMGVLRVECLREALHEIGFTLPNKSLALIIIKFVREDGMLRFGDFVSAILALDRAFRLAHNKNSLRNLSIAELLHLHLSC